VRDRFQEWFGNGQEAARVVLDRERVGKSGAPDLMMKCAIEDACKAGCRYFHQGGHRSASVRSPARWIE